MPPFAQLRGDLERDWARWEIVKVDEALIRRAGELAGEHRLRGYDSVHLAAVEGVFSAFQKHPKFRFAVFDMELRAAAKQAAIPVLKG
jgi:predicted nucleic acid-binding protein